MAVQEFGKEAHGLAEILLPVVEKFGLLGLALILLAWIVTAAIPHVTRAWVDDRKNRRAYALHKRKLEIEREARLTDGQRRGERR